MSAHGAAVAVKCSDGIVIGCANLLHSAYGYRIKYECERYALIDENTLLVGSGDFPDLQHLVDLLKEMSGKEDTLYERHRRPQEYHNYLSRLLHDKRNNMAPLLLQSIVAGRNPASHSRQSPALSGRLIPSPSSQTNGGPLIPNSSDPTSSAPNNLSVDASSTEEFFLGTVDPFGTSMECNFFATQLLHYLAMPILRQKWRPDLKMEEARKMVVGVLNSACTSDARSGRQIQIATITQDGVKIEDTMLIHGN